MSRPWMPLYIADYLADTAHLRAAESGAYIHLIMHYWQHGGLPDSDRLLATIAKMTDQEWMAARPIIEVLFQPGWKHKRVDHELAEAEKKYQRRAAAGKRGAEAKAKQCSSIATSNAEAGLNHVGVVVSSKDSPPSETLQLALEEKKEETGDTRARGAGASWPPNAFDHFWSVYPHKIAKPTAHKAFDRIRRSSRAPPWAEFMAGLNRYIGKTDDRPWCNPATFLNGERWADRPSEQPLGNGNGQHRQSGGEGRSFSFSTYARRLAGAGAG